MGHLGITGTGIMVPLEQEWGTLPERAQRLTCQEVHWASQASSLPVAIYSEKHEMQPCQLISSLALNQYSIQTVINRHCGLGAAIR